MILWVQGEGCIKLGCLFSVKLDLIRILDETLGNNITYPVSFKSQFRKHLS